MPSLPQHPPRAANSGEPFLAAPFAWAPVLTLGLTLAVACSDASAGDAVRVPDSRPWTRVLENGAVTIAIDTASAVRWWNDTYAILVRSDHVRPRVRDGRRWDREISGVQLRCDYPATRTRAVRLSLGDGTPILDQREEESDVWEQPWHEAPPGTDEERAARAACALLQTKPAPVASKRGLRTVPSF